VRPLAATEEHSSLEFFRLLNFILRFCPKHPSEKALMARFAKLNIGAGTVFDPDALTTATQKAVEAGMVDAWTDFAEFKETQLDTGMKTSADGFGTRAFLKNDYMVRMASAVLGIYGNSKEEAIYPAYFVDAGKKKLEGVNRYTLRFAPGQLPPVNAFWSLTVYELPASLLYANSLSRYLINSPMLPSLKRDHDGGITLYVQNESPGPEQEPNWLPAPKGPFLLVMRLYWPKPAALDGQWKQPPLQKVA
jgi:hypothetical protein